MLPLRKKCLLPIFSADIYYYWLTYHSSIVFKLRTTCPNLNFINRRPSLSVGLLYTVLTISGSANISLGYPQIFPFLMSIWTIRCQKSGSLLFVVWVFSEYYENVTLGITSAAFSTITNKVLQQKALVIVGWASLLAFLSSAGKLVRKRVLSPGWWVSFPLNLPIWSRNKKIV